MRVLEVALVGARGRMGRAVRDAIGAREDVRLVAACVRPGDDQPDTIDGLTPCDSLPAELTPHAVIDFSSPDGTRATLEACAARRLPLVVATTALSRSDEDAIDALSAHTAVLVAPNLSIGVCLLYRLVRAAASALPDADIEIVETHHRGKRDAPSGTALRLASVVEATREGTRQTHGRTGEALREPGEIGVHAVRAGDVVGDHLVVLGLDGERVELGHRATSRRAFAEGALRAARFVSTAPPGRYDMDAILPG